MALSKNINRKRVRNWRQNQKDSGGKSLSVYLDGDSAVNLKKLLDITGDNNTALVKRALQSLYQITCNKSEPSELTASEPLLESYKQLNNQLTAILNATSESVWVCDGRGIVQSINKSSERLLGIKADEVIGKSVQTLVDQGFMDSSATLEVLKSGRQVNMLQYVSKVQKDLLVTSTPVFNDDGEIVMVVSNERDLTELNHLRRQLQEARAETRKVKAELTGLNLLELKQQDIIAESSAMQNVLQTALKLAEMDISNVLILGESGTGKGLIAKIIHEASNRNKQPLIVINCAALPESLLEAELFGYEKGAFTGARREGKPGLFELAKKGTIFLDEIGELPLNIQAKLLKCLDEFEILRLGGLKPIKINCAVVTATNRDLDTLVKQREFRKDLYFRLSPFKIEIPPLRQRREDIFPLAQFYLEKYNQEFNSTKTLSNRALEQLRKYSFPGNIRELKNVIKQAVVLQESDHIVDLILSGDTVDDGSSSFIEDEMALSSKGLKAAMEACEKMILQKALDHCASTRQMASYLKISQPSVVRKMKYHELGFASKPLSRG